MNNILINTEMALAILDGRKTQTRRVVPKHIEIIGYNKGRGFVTYSNNGSKTHDTFSVDEFISDFSKYKKDEVIWVREPAKVIDFDQDDIQFIYIADRKYSSMPTPSRFLNPTPSWIADCQGIPNGCIKEMARIFLKINNVRVERLQDLTIEDILSEGFPIATLTENYEDKELIDKAMEWWIKLWNKTAPKGYKYEDNPPVLVYKLKRVNKDRSEI